MRPFAARVTVAASLESLPLGSLVALDAQIARSQCYARIHSFNRTTSRRFPSRATAPHSSNARHGC
jgi:hypothetical protein